MCTDNGGASPTWWQWTLSATMCAVGIGLIATGVGGFVGGALLSAGINSIVTGYLNEAQGGSFTAGWAGGAILGGFVGAGASLGGSALMAASSAVGGQVIIGLGKAIAYSFAGGYIGSLVGAELISKIDQTPTNWKAWNNNALLCGTLNILGGFGSGMSSTVIKTGSTVAYKYVGCLIALGTELACDAVTTGYSILSTPKKNTSYGGGGGGWVMMPK